MNASFSLQVVHDSSSALSCEVRLVANGFVIAASGGERTAVIGTLQDVVILLHLSLGSYAS